MQAIKRLDIVSILLTIFMVLLISLFGYLYKVDKGIQNYTLNHDHIIPLELIDKQLNDFSATVNTLSDYDKVNQKLFTFQKNLKILEENLQRTYADNVTIEKQLRNIKKNYENKAQELEYFKSLNASLISGSHFLFDLQRTIADDKNISTKVKSLINEALFYILRYTNSSYIDKSYVRNKLHELKKLTQHSKFVKNFYKQSLIMLDTVAELKNSAKNIHNSRLADAITDLHKTLDTKYKQDLAIQKNIALLFFLSVIIMLIALIITHIHALKNEKELLAFKYAVQHSDNTIVITDPQKKITSISKMNC
ncbi:MAG: hypothetical protein FAF04_08430 [Epsilonproteobacteria bacterium]|nr:hypothetical protein [Campylobacterota bacterium]